MAIITDPTNLDRNQVIFGTTNKMVSLYPVGAIKNTASNTDGVTNAGAKTFTSALGNFVVKSITAGDILTLKNKADAGHFVVKSRDSATQLTLEDVSFVGYQANFTGSTDVTYEVRSATGGTITDGVTLQCLYSYAKEQWRSDTTNVGGEDLINYVFPMEAITTEKFEIGGDTMHGDWEFLNDYTRKKIKTAGFASKNTALTTRNEWAGILTVGSLDDDTRVYYQQTSQTTAPVDFTYPGEVNEPIEIYDGSTSYKTYLKIFARKKARSYAETTISDIGVTSLTAIVNRFALTHETDVAITASDAEIMGSAPFRNVTVLVSGTNGVIADVNTSTGTLSSAGKTFLASKVVAGDTLKITSGDFINKYFTILSVDSETQVTVDTSEDGPFTPASSITYSISTTIRSAVKAAGAASDITDGALANVDGTTGTLTSASSNFTTDGVLTGDIVIIKEAASAYRGVYRVITKDTATQLTLDTTDKTFGTVSNIDFIVVQPGMYLQYKNETITLAATGDITFAATGNKITRASGSWVTDGVTAGDIITITNSVSNNGSFTCLSVGGTGNRDLTCISTDVITDEGAVAATATAYTPFKRTTDDVVHGFAWKVLCNSASLQNVYQFVQHQLRQTTDINYGVAAPTLRGDVTDLLMTYLYPSGNAINMYLDSLSGSDMNNVTYTDATGATVVNPYFATCTLKFNDNIVNDANAKYWLFFTTNPSGDYGTDDAIIVQDATMNEITGMVSGQATIAFTFDYDGNAQGFRATGTDADVTLVVIGLEIAQFVLVEGTITRSVDNTIEAISSLERNYQNL